MEDGFAEAGGLRPVMQMRIDVDVKTAEGEVVKTTVYSTINRVGN